MSEYCFYLSNKTKNINIYVFNFEESKYNVSSVLLYDNTDCILFDTQFEKENACKISNFIKDKNLNLNFIFITCPDPEYYFGVYQIIKDHKTIVYASAQVCRLIKSTYKFKLLNIKNLAPEKIILPEVYISNVIWFKTVKLEIIKTINYEFILSEDLSIILANNIISHNLHICLVGLDRKKGIDDLIKAANYIKIFNVNHIIPGHFILQNNDLYNAYRFTIFYLETFKIPLEIFKKSEDISRYMLNMFPNLPKTNNLELSSKYLTKEIQTFKYNSFFPPINKNVIVDFKKYKFLLRFYDDKMLGFQDLNNPEIYDYTEYVSTEIGKNIFMVNWFEKKTNSNIVSIQNWNLNKIWTNIFINSDIVEGYERKINMEGTINIIL